MPFADRAKDIKVASVLDLGSNSVKIANYAIDSNGGYKPYHQESVRLKLSEGLQDGILKEEYINDTVAALKLFRNIVDVEGIRHVVSVATSAIRDAKNREAILGRIRRETGFDFRVISDRDEALFSYTGAMRELQIPTVLFFDIGGGSLEIVYAQEYHVQKIESLPLGALRLTSMFSGEPDGRVDLSRMDAHVSEEIPYRNDLGIPDGEEIVLAGAGGLLRTLAKYDQYRIGYGLSKQHNYPLKYSSVKKIYEEIRHLQNGQIAHIPQIGGGRADTAKAGCLVLLRLMKRLDFDTVIVSAHGLREGTLALSLAHRREFDAQSVSYMDAADTIHSIRRVGFLPEQIEGFVRLLSEMDLLSYHEQALLSYALEHADKLQTFRDVDNSLYALMDYDSRLDHGDQLAAVLALIRSRKKSKVAHLAEKFDDILGANDKKLIRKLSHMVAVCEILRKASLAVDAQSGPDSVLLRVRPQSSVFPTMLLRRACSKLEGSLGKRVETILDPEPSPAQEA